MEMSHLVGQADKHLAWYGEKLHGGWEDSTDIFVKECGCIIPSVRSKKKIRYCRSCRRNYPLTTHPVTDKIYKARVRQLEKDGTLKYIREADIAKKNKG